MYNRNRGFTLIELMIAIIIAGILFFIIFVGAQSAPGSSISFGVNGVVETRCINGYSFIVGRGGQARQVLDEFGKDARC